MRAVINKDYTFERSEKPIDEALTWAKEHDQPYKVELLNDLKREGTTLVSELDATMMGMELPAGIGELPRLCEKCGGRIILYRWRFHRSLPWSPR